MKLICNGNDLADSFSKVIKAITGKKAIPILEGVKISAFGDTVTLTATDTELTIQNSIKATIMLEGEIVVQGRFTAELMRKICCNQVELETIENNQLIIKYLNSKSKIKCMNLEEFPPIYEGDYEICLPLDKITCKSFIDKTIFSVASDEVRPILKGCLLKIDGDKLQCVALDGYRLAIATQKIDKNYGNKQIIIPAKALFEIAKLIDENDEVVKFYISNKKLLVDLNSSKIIVSLIEGEFLQYENIIPRQFTTEITIIREQLIQGLDRVSTISKLEKSNLISIEVKDNILTIYSKAELGDITEKIGVNLKGKEIKIGINAKYILDCIKAVDDEYIKMSIVNSTDPCVITPLNGDSFLYLILPIRVIA